MRLARSFIAVAILALAALAGTGLHAQSDMPDCGDPPGNEPAIPDGGKAARDTMLDAVRAVKQYSEAVDAWLACKDQRALTVFQWMNEAQRQRWEEDLAAIHDRRVEVQRQMNEQIRIFNQRSGSS
ncbi:MAG: hypothetical protein Kow00104_16850 [Rhodothalassiaceae bacterium]